MENGLPKLTPELIKSTYEFFDKMLKNLRPKYVGQSMKMFLGNSEYAEREFEVLRFDIIATLNEGGDQKKLNEVADIIDNGSVVSINPIVVFKYAGESIATFPVFVAANNIQLSN